jgi:hypothetical protein
MTESRIVTRVKDLLSSVSMFAVRREINYQDVPAGFCGIAKHDPYMPSLA